MHDVALVSPPFPPQLFVYLCVYTLVAAIAQFCSYDSLSFFTLSSAMFAIFSFLLPSLSFAVLNSFCAFRFYAPLITLIATHAFCFFSLDLRIPFFSYLYDYFLFNIFPVSAGVCFESQKLILCLLPCLCLEFFIR